MTAPLENQGSSPTGAGVPRSSKETDNHTPSSGSEPKASPGPTFFWPLLLGAISIVVAYFLTRKNQQTAATLSEVYALCSEQGNSVYTVDYNNNKVQCVVVNGSYIAGIGSLETIKTSWHDKNLQIRFVKPGTIIIPGISDSHGHILEYGANQQLPLEEAKSIPDVVARVREYIISTPEVYNDTSKVISGGGWDHTIWPSTGWPSASDLDADSVIRGRYVVLQSKDCHALWVSSRAIEASQPFPETIEGGVIVRDDSGKPTGVFLDNAQDLLKQPPLTESDLLRRFKVAVRDAHRYGLTSIHDAGLDPVSLAFFKRQAEIGTLPIRIYGMTYFNENEPYWGNTTIPIVGSASERLSARSVKIFADGALRTGGAAVGFVHLQKESFLKYRINDVQLYEPYTDNPSSNGFMRLDPEVLFDVIPKFLRDGWQVNVHAIGDRANGIVLDAFEASLSGANVTALRPRLEHAQMMTTADMIRLGKLGVIASIQPTHVISDMWYAQDRLGPKRVKSLYAFRSLVDSGARIALGSDFPVESMNPLSGFYAAITRKSPTGQSPHGLDGWFPEQRLSREEALRGMTIDAAYASFTENYLGSLEIGKRADLTVLSRDIMSIPVEEILGTEVYATVIDGKPVYGSI